MLHIDKSRSKQPQILALAIQDMRRTPGQTVCYDNLPSYVTVRGRSLSVRDELLKALIEDQRGLCAYCMRRIEPRNAHIEHYIPRHCDWYQGKRTLDELSVDYRNMLAVCKENGTCDATRGNAELTVDPRNQSDIEQIRYNTKAEILSDNTAIDSDCRGLLNLNDGFLVYGRMQTLQGLYRWYQHESRRAGDMKSKCRKRLDELQNGTGHNDPYAGILIYRLERKIRALS
ncbi:hypothetical protein [Bifidobacterium oedipodis]|uniref:TIGR02646 family protein n=1 Tax=Bifidobacterium oedipodis TaxID=2675322 RepID=A0A7Y0ERE5_9BIFI|nr:hypothetical protein [Bifidobacterium sp. DSM 109957]NMM95005.1 hypothetical protein [Bifidobacterium sp. DSM 109957]